MLNVNGTESAPVSLTSAALVPAPGDWDGLRFFSGSSGSIAGAEVAHAFRARLLRGRGPRNGGTLSIIGTVLESNGTYGAYAGNGAVFTLDDVVAENNHYGFYAEGAATGTVSRLDAYRYLVVCRRPGPPSSTVTGPCRVTLPKRSMASR